MSAGVYLAELAGNERYKIAVLSNVELRWGIKIKTRLTLLIKMLLKQDLF